MVLANDSIQNIFKTSDTQGTGLGANANIKILNDGSTINVAGYTILGTGTVVLAATTDAYDVNYIDIPISNGAVSDTIIIETYINNITDKVIYCQIDIKDTTATGSVVQVGVGAGNNGSINTTLVQDGNTNDLIICTQLYRNAITIEMSGIVIDTNDANIFTTPFTIRLNFKFISQPASASHTIRYKAYKITN